MTQYLVEEACAISLDAWEAARVAEQARDDALSAHQTATRRRLEQMMASDR